MNHWIIPANEDVFHLEALLETTELVDWKQQNNYEVGDIVFIYNSKPYRRIRFKMMVVAVDLSSKDYINDKVFWGDKHNLEDGLNKNRFVRLKLVSREPIKGGPSFDLLRKFGLKANLQSAVKISDSTLLNEIQRYMNPDSEGLAEKRLTIQELLKGRNSNFDSSQKVKLVRHSTTFRLFDKDYNGTISDLYNVENCF